MCEIYLPSVEHRNPLVQRNFRQCEGNIGEAVEQEEKLCGEMKTVREFTYLGDRVSAVGGYYAAVTVRIRSGRVKFRGAVSCCIAGDVLYG